MAHKRHPNDRSLSYDEREKIENGEISPVNGDGISEFDLMIGDPEEGYGDSDYIKNKLNNTN